MQSGLNLLFPLQKRMKYYKSHWRGQATSEFSFKRDIGTILEGHSIVFIFNASAYGKAFGLTLKLMQSSVSIYNVHLDSLSKRVSYFTSSSKTNSQPFDGPEKDTNIVFRIYRTSVDAATASPCFMTYINGKFIASIEAFNGTVFNVVDLDIKRISSGCITELVLFVAVFNEAEKEQATAFAEAMRTPEAGYLATAKQPLEDNVRVVERYTTCHRASIVHILKH